MNREIVRMNLTGLEPVMLERIKDIAERTMRRFDGAPEQVAEFNEAREVLAIISEVEASR